MSDIFSRSYRVERQHSVDGETWTPDLYFICMPSFPIVNPFYRFTRYVEYSEYGERSQVVYQGEYFPDEVRWQIVNKPWNPAIW